MKIITDFPINPTLEQRIGLYVWGLGKNLLTTKRMLRRQLKYNDWPIEFLEFNKGIELEAHNTYYGAKEYFWDIIKK